jgi:hypothetical protein
MVIGSGEIGKPLRGRGGVKQKALAVTYFHMGKPHTIIGEAPFHF